MTDPNEREAMIQELLDRTSLNRDEAEEFVAIHLGESEGDVAATRPLSPDERRRFGLGLTWEEARQRRRALLSELAVSKERA